MTACGTYAGYVRHQKAGEALCEDCRTVRNAYMRAWRRRANRNPNVLVPHDLVQRAASAVVQPRSSDPSLAAELRACLEGRQP